MATELPETDVVVIGLGAAGGVAVLPLARAGLQVIGLEAGSWMNPGEDYRADEIHNNVRSLVTTGHKVGSETPTFRTSPDQVARQAADTRGLGRIRRVVLQVVTVLLDSNAAARGVHDDGFDFARFDQRPPGVDVVFHLNMGRVLVVQMELHAAAATRQGFDLGLNATGIQHPGRGAVDVGAHAGLHATGQHQHLAGMRPGRPKPCGLFGRHLGLQQQCNLRGYVLGNPAARHGERWKNLWRRKDRWRSFVTGFVVHLLADLG